MRRGSFLVLAATDGELTRFRELLEGPDGKRVRDAIEIRVTGVGKVACALGAAAAIDALRPDRVLQLGAAGAYPASGLVVGDVVIATGEVLADDGVEGPDGFIALDDLGFPAAKRDAETLYNRVPVDAPPPALREALRASFATSFHVQAGRLATVSAGSGTDERARILEMRWRAVAETLEGAAAAVVAWTRSTPFREVRGISNLAGHRHRDAWQLDTACEHASHVALAWLREEATDA